jgi:hypothetical protein
MIFQTLGQFSEYYPEEMTVHAKRLAELYMANLEEQFKTTEKEQRKVVDGILIGLKHFLVNFAEYIPKGACS